MIAAITERYPNVFEAGILNLFWLSLNESTRMEDITKAFRRNVYEKLRIVALEHVNDLELIEEWKYVVDYCDIAIRFKSYWLFVFRKNTSSDETLLALSQLYFVLCSCTFSSTTRFDSLSKKTICTLSRIFIKQQNGQLSLYDLSLLTLEALQRILKTRRSKQSNSQSSGHIKGSLEFLSNGAILIGAENCCIKDTLHFRN